MGQEFLWFLLKPRMRAYYLSFCPNNIVHIGHGQEQSCITLQYKCLTASYNSISVDVAQALFAQWLYILSICHHQQENQHNAYVLSAYHEMLQRNNIPLLVRYRFLRTIYLKPPDTYIRLEKAPFPYAPVGIDLQLCNTCF